MSNLDTGAKRSKTPQKKSTVENRLKCPRCGNTDTSYLTVQERGTVNEMAIQPRKDGKIGVEHLETNFDGAKYNMHCFKCLYEWPISYDDLVF